MKTPLSEATIRQVRRTKVATAQSLGPKLLEKRLAQGLTMRQFCDGHDIDISTLSRFERGFDINYSVLTHILKAHGCYICGSDGEEL